MKNYYFKFTTTPPPLSRDEFLKEIKELSDYIVAGETLLKLQSPSYKKDWVPDWLWQLVSDEVIR